MSLALNILEELRRNPGSTAEEVADAVKDTAVRVRQNLSVMGSPTGGKLVSKELDEVTRKPGYKITASGIAKLQLSSSGATPKTQPEVVKNTGSKDSVCHSEGQAVANKTPEPDAGTPPSKAEGAGGDDSNEKVLLSILYDIRQAIGDKDGKLMLGDLAGQIKGICEIGEAHRRDCDLWEKSMKSAIGEDYVIGVGIAIEKLKSELATERQAREALQEQINAYDELNHGHHYYFVIAPKRPIKMFKKLKNAREASKTAIRAGAAFAEVVPGLKAIGRAMRGAEWRGHDGVQ